MEVKLSENSATIGNFGVEIEFLAPVDRAEIAAAVRNAGISCNAQEYNHVTGPAWKIITDSSVRDNTGKFQGMELVSPILNGKDGLAQIEPICRVLNQTGCKVNMTCGLHVHHEAGEFGMDKIGKMIKYYKKAEPVLDSMMPNSRRGDANHYCQTMKKLDENRLPDSRYFKVNFQSLVRHGTVEFRHHSGSIDADKIQCWVILTALIMHRIIKGGQVKSDKPYKKWLELKWDLGLSFKGQKSPEAEKMIGFYYDRIKSLAA